MGSKVSTVQKLTSKGGLVALRGVTCKTKDATTEPSIAYDTTIRTVTWHVGKYNVDKFH